MTREEAIMRIRAVAEKIGREPSTADMDGRTGPYCRIFGSWETAKKEAGVKGYVAPEKPKPKVAVTNYRYALTPEELAHERKLFLERHLGYPFSRSKP